MWMSIFPNIDEKNTVHAIIRYNYIGNVLPQDNLKQLVKANVKVESIVILPY